MPRYNEDYDPNKDSGYGNAFKVDYHSLICPLTIMSGQNSGCILEKCAFWSVRSSVCIFCSSINQLGYMARAVNWHINREERRRGYASSRPREQRQPGEDDAL